jgi:hypothetical protein
MPRISLPKTSKQSLPAFTPSISGKTRGDGEKWLRYLDSASINYPGTDTLVLAFFLAETSSRMGIPQFSLLSFMFLFSLRLINVLKNTVNVSHMKILHMAKNFENFEKL